MHPIKAYCRTNNVELGELAKELNKKLPKKKRNLNNIRLLQYISGYRRPGPELARIMAQTLGVPLDEILFPNC